MADFDDTSLSLPSNTNPSYFTHLLLPSQPPQQDPRDATTPPAPTRRPRGRPPGSKNKPKLPFLLSRQSPNSLRTHILEFSLGTDILTSLHDFARRGERGLAILSGSGIVSDISLRNSGSSSLLNLRGKFQIMTIRGTVLPPPAPPGSGGLSLFMSGSQGQVVGGCVASRLLAAGPVVLVVASFSNAVYERLPLMDTSEDGGWDGRVAAGSQSSSTTGCGGGWVGDGNCTGFSGLTYVGDLLGWAGNGEKAQFN